MGVAASWQGNPARARAAKQKGWGATVAGPTEQDHNGFGRQAEAETKTVPLSDGMAGG